MLLPWREREYNAHPTKCSYLTCTILAYYEAFGQLCVAVRVCTKDTRGAPNDLDELLGLVGAMLSLDT